MKYNVLQKIIHFCYSNTITAHKYSYETYIVQETAGNFRSIMTTSDQLDEERPIETRKQDKKDSVIKSVFQILVWLHPCSELLKK